MRRGVRARQDRRLLPPVHRTGSRAAPARSRCSAPDDYVITTYRDHGQALARGMTPRAVMAELFGRTTAARAARAARCTCSTAASNFLGGHGIVGGHVPLATGVGFAIKYRGGDQVMRLLHGRVGREHRRVPRGAQHGRRSGSCPSCSSSRTTATAWAPRSSARRPSTTSTSAAPRTTCRAPSCDGQDVFAVRAAVQKAIDRARTESHADAARGAHVSLHGSLDVRRGERHVPHEGGARGVHEARPDHRCSARTCRSTAS